MSIIAADAGRGPIAAPARRPPPHPVGRRLLGVWSAVAFVTLGGLLVFGILQDPSPVPRSVEAVQPAWVDMGKTLRLYTLESPDYGREPTLYEARRHRSGGGRQDFLTYGPGFAAGPYLRIALYRPGTEPAPSSGFFLDLARTAALAGLGVTRSTMPTPLQTRFGPFEAAEFNLSEGPVARACMAFRLKNAEPAFFITGFACPGSGVPDRMALACTLERLDLLAAADDHGLAAFFASAELRRSATCLSTPSEKPALRNVAPAQKVSSAGRKGAGPLHRSSLD